MATLFDQYSEENTVRTQILSVESAPDFRVLPLLKSTEIGLPDGLSFVDENSEPLGDVKRCDIYVDGILVENGGFCASVQTYVTTLEQAKKSKIDRFTSSATSAVKAIDVLSDDIDLQKKAIVDALAVKIESVNSAVTLQDLDAV